MVLRDESRHKRGFFISPGETPERTQGEMPEATETQSNVTNEQSQTQGQGETPKSWDEWLNTQAEPVKTLYTQHVTGLRNTVQATRQERDDLAKQIKDLLPKAEKGSEMEQSLSDALGRIELAERRAAFFEDAAKPEIGCRNPRLAWTLAQADSLFDRKGNPDWSAIKQAAPELFGSQAVNANAGAGTQNPVTKRDMNAWIRNQTGR